MQLDLTLVINFSLSLLGYIITFRLIPKFGPMFLKKNICGIDLGKANGIKIPEAMGAICGFVFFIVMCLFIPFSSIPYWTTKTAEPFPHHQNKSVEIQGGNSLGLVTGEQFNKNLEVTISSESLLVIKENGTLGLNNKLLQERVKKLEDELAAVKSENATLRRLVSELTTLVEYVVALVSILSMLFFGFADDVLDMKWRYKLLLPTISSLPLLMVYYVTYNGTTVIIPKPFQNVFGKAVWLGPLYYVYMGMLAVFCTNAINIYAGINGLEVGQAVVISLSIVIFNGIELFGECSKAHMFSLYFMIPFLFTAFALLYYNWYPASVFVGDTFCYFAGMTFAVVGVLGHFSKTMLLFFIPQVINFLFSCPQLFHFVPCPRHRLPRYNKETNLMEPSTVIFKPKTLTSLGHFCLSVAKTFKLVNYEEKHKDGETYAECTNFTVINYLLKLLGPTHEKMLTIYLLTIQVLCSCLAFFIRYGLSKVFYDS